MENSFSNNNVLLLIPYSLASTVVHYLYAGIVGKTSSMVHHPGIYQDQQHFNHKLS